MGEFNDEVRVEYRIDATVNTGNFENVKPGYAVSTNVRPGEHPNQARERLQTLVNVWILEDIDGLRTGK